jgi:alkylation response protein AidB-like acyl-CoA dehydrogenase
MNANPYKVYLDGRTHDRPKDAAGPESGRAAHGADLGALRARLPALCAAIAEFAADRELRRELPFDGFERVRRAGLGALRLPETLGGPGGRPSDVIATVAALAAAEPNLAHALRSHFNFTEGLALDPTGARAQRYAALVLEGAIFGGAHTELGTSTPGDVTTRLVRDGAGYRLHGRKHYATGTAFADHAAFSALDEDGAFRNILIPTSRAGLTILDDWDGMGQRTTASGGVVFDGVAVGEDEIDTRPISNRIGRHQSTLRQLHLCACTVGIVRCLVAETADYVRTSARAAAHSPAATAAEDLFVQKVVGEIAAASFALDALIEAAARSLDEAAEGIEGDTPDLEDRLIASALATAKTQIVAARLALDAAESLYETGGGSATSRRLNFDRHWRNIRTILSHNPLLHKARVVGDHLLNGTTTHLLEGRVF